MGRRQTRIFQRDILPQAASLPGKEANIVLTNQATLHGVVLEISGDNLIIRDMRLKKHTVSLAHIHEITLDYMAEW